MAAMTHLATEGYQAFHLGGGDKAWLYFALAAGLVGILAGLVLIRGVLKADQGTDKMREIARAIQEGAEAFLKRQFRTILLIIVPLAVLIFFTATKVTRPDGSVALSFSQAGMYRVICFLFGAAFSGLTGFIGMSVAVRGNVRTAAAARGGKLPPALKVAYRTGAITGLLCVGLGLLGATVIVLIFQNTATSVLIGFAFGASLLALFMRVGGGIFTKAADVGADLVGKVEAGIPEDDPRNPAVIADNVGDNVGDCAGMAADLFETYVVTTVAAMLLGHLFLGNILESATTFPLILGAISIVASIIGTFFVRMRSDSRGSIMGALYNGPIVAGVLAAIGFYFATRLEFAGDVTLGNVTITPLGVFFCALVGLAITGLITWITEYYTGTQYPPVKQIAKASVTGHATNIIAGLAVSMQATALPAITIVIGILVSNWLAGIYGVGIAVMAMLSMAGIIVAIDSFGPITDNAGGIAEMAALPESVRAVTAPLDAV